MIYFWSHKLEPKNPRHVIFMVPISDTSTSKRTSSKGLKTKILTMLNIMLTINASPPNGFRLRRQGSSLPIPRCIVAVAVTRNCRHCLRESSSCLICAARSRELDALSASIALFFFFNSSSAAASPFSFRFRCSAALASSSCLLSNASL